jgi:hypothetical protein
MSDLGLSIVLGIALAAATGFRVFLPMLICATSGATLTGSTARYAKIGARSTSRRWPSAAGLTAILMRFHGSSPISRRRRSELSAPGPTSIRTTERPGRRSDSSRKSCDSSTIGCGDGKPGSCARRNCAPTSRSGASRRHGGTRRRGGGSARRAGPRRLTLTEAFGLASGA